MATKLIRDAQLIAEAVTVVCPTCSECQPNPRDGSHMWTKDDFNEKSVGVHSCVSCEERIRISSQNKVQF